jgi:hypothetical protein
MGSSEENILFPSITEISFEDNLLTIDDMVYQERPIERDLSFMALCQRYGLYYNKLKNEKEMLYVFIIPG